MSSWNQKAAKQQHVCTARRNDNMYWRPFWVVVVTSNFKLFHHNLSPQKEEHTRDDVFWLSSPFPLALFFRYLTKAHGFLTQPPPSYHTVGPTAAAWSLPAAAEGTAAFHRALLPTPGGTRRWRRLPGATAWIHGRTLLSELLHSAMLLDLLQAQRRSESSARLAPLLALQKLEGKSDAAALPALPVGPGKAHAALPLALLDGVARLLLQWLWEPSKALSFLRQMCLCQISRTAKLLNVVIRLKGSGPGAMPPPGRRWATRLRTGPGPLHARARRESTARS